MALTFTPSPVYPNDVWGSVNVRLVTATPAASDYVAGGYPLAASLGKGITLAVIYFVIPLSGGVNTPVFNPTTGNLQVYAAGAEVAAGTDLSATPFTLLIVGK